MDRSLVSLKQGRGRGFFCLGVDLGFTWQRSGTTPGGMQGIKARSVTCKARVHLAVLPLWPHGRLFGDLLPALGPDTHREPLKEAPQPWGSKRPPISWAKSPVAPCLLLFCRKVPGKGQVS